MFMLRLLLVSLALGAMCMAQVPRTPDIESQRSAMKKLEFLVGKWSGEARVFRLTNQPVELVQTEEAYYKLDGLLLIIEGIGRNRSDGKTALQALGVVSYDDETGTYRMRAYNDGRYLETELTLSDSGKGISWGFTFGLFCAAKDTRYLWCYLFPRRPGQSVHGHVSPMVSSCLPGSGTVRRENRIEEPRLLPLFR